jgi:hypothetical protein
MEQDTEKEDIFALSYTAKTKILTSGDPRELGERLGISDEAPRKRGRPKVMSELFEFSIGQHFRHLKTDRGRQNIKYAYLAMGALDIGPKGAGLAEFGWLVDWEAADKNRKDAIKWGILTEFGRLADLATAVNGLDIVRDFAAAICQRKPSIKEGIALLRRQRLKLLSERDDFEAWRASKRDDDLLYNRFADVINQYKAEHPEMTMAEIFAVVDRLHANLAMRAG